MAQRHQFPLKPIRIEGDIAYVPLSRGLEAIIDASDAELIGKFNWCARPASQDFYAVCSVQEGGIRRQVAMHNFLMKPSEGNRVDHASTDTLDNRRSNLRVVTHAQNMQNRGFFRNNSTGFKGVVPVWKKFRAQIRANGVLHILGTFATAQEAGEAYQEASIRLHGDYRSSAIRSAKPDDYQERIPLTYSQRNFLCELSTEGVLGKDVRSTVRAMARRLVTEGILVDCGDGEERWCLTSLGEKALKDNPVRKHAYPPTRKSRCPA